MPHKVWAVGEEVLAADFQTVVQNQVIPVFATAAARDAAITAPVNGQTCYLSTPRLYETWNGSAWVPIGAALGSYYGRLTAPGINHPDGTAVSPQWNAITSGARAFTWTNAGVQIPLAGVYQCRAQIQVPHLANSSLIMEIRKGGVGQTETQVSRNIASSPIALARLGTSAPLLLAVGDVITTSATISGGSGIGNAVLVVHGPL